MAGPRNKCTAETVARAVTLKQGGAINKDIAFAIGVSESTFYRWISTPKTDRQRELSEELKKAEADYKNALLGIIASNAQKKDWKAAAWLLERKYPQEYGRRYLDARISGDVQVSAIDKKTRQEMDRLLGLDGDKS